MRKSKKVGTTRILDVIVHPILDVVSVPLGWVLLQLEGLHDSRRLRR